MSDRGVDKFLSASRGIFRDLLNTLAADLDVHVRHISIAYVWDEQDRAFGWRVGINLDETMAYAFDSDMVNAIEKLAHGWKRIRAGESIIEDTAHRVH